MDRRTAMKVLSAGAAGLLGGTGEEGLAAGGPKPKGSGTGLLWGVDDAGGPFHMETKPWAAELMDAFGFDLWVSHRWHSPDIAKTVAAIERVDAWCKQEKIQWMDNVEGANWRASFVDEKGRDWFNREDGRHFHLFPDEILEVLGRCGALRGIVYDEAAHMQNCANSILNEHKPFAPWVYDPAGDRLEEAADKFADAVGEVARVHGQYGLSLFSEHVFPVLFHAFARGGWTACTKILKENWSPAYVACAMGAALQYDTELWVTPDLWGVTGYPGHSPAEYDSALRLAYHLGADALYTENLGYDHEDKGQGSLVYVEGDNVRVTDYGQVAQRFIRSYVPSHPRPYSFREVKPRVAIVRRPDACWGQATSWLKDRLFGRSDWQSTRITEGWLKIWHLLTRGVIPADGLSWHASSAYAGRPYQLFCPLDGVVVFDDRVEPRHLDGVEGIFLTGLGLEENTLQAVAKRVEEGSLCVAFPHLLPKDVRAKTGENGECAAGKGRWVATEDFLSPLVRKRTIRLLPAFDRIRYVFGEHTVSLRCVDGDPSRLEFEEEG